MEKGDRMSGLDGNAAVQKNTVAPCAVVPDNIAVSHENPRLDEHTAGDGNDKALSALSVVHGNYDYVSFDGFKGANVSLFNKLAVETIEETSNEKEVVTSDE